MVGTVSLVTLGVRNVAAATEFYERLGFARSPASVPGEVSFFRTPGCALAVWSAAELATDSTAAGGSIAAPTSIPAPGDFRGVALAINVDSRARVDAVLAHAESVGADIRRPALATEWGGYSGYFADPDGHLWEVAHNPGWPLDERGLPQLP